LLAGDWQKLLFLLENSLAIKFLVLELFQQGIYHCKNVNVDCRVDGRVDCKSHEKTKDGKYRKENENIPGWRELAVISLK
jgi:hypothetical protein